MTALPSKQAEGVAAVHVVPKKAVSPLKQVERAAVVPAVSGEPEARRDPVTLQGQSK